LIELVICRISSEDAASGGVLSHTLQSRPKNQQIIASAAAAIANLATNENDQVMCYRIRNGTISVG